MNTVRACIFFPTFAFFSIYYTMEKADIFLKVKRFTLISMILFLFLGSVVLIKLTETTLFQFLRDESGGDRSRQRGGDDQKIETSSSIIQ